jgi:2,3-bisphosphoglycerate-dependent phosphoglycerate mutase
VWTDVVLVRHAQAVVRTADGPEEPDRPLTAEGRRQALGLVETLSGLGPVAVWSSPYRRAVQTVEPTARALGLAVGTRWELREWEDGLPFTDEWEPHYAESWAKPSWRRPGGESMEQVTVRAVAAVRTLARECVGRVVLVGGHGTFLTRALGGFGEPVDAAFWHGMPTPAVFRLRFTDPAANPTVSSPPFR